MSSPDERVDSDPLSRDAPEAGRTEPNPPDSERRPTPSGRSPAGIRKRLLSRAAVLWVIVGALAVLFGLLVVLIGLSILREPGVWNPMRWLTAIAFVLPIGAALVALVWYGRQIRGTAAERARAEDSFRTVASTMGDGIVTIDDRSRIQFVNDAVGRIFGYMREELLGKELTVLMPERLHAKHRAGIQRYVSSGRRSVSWESLQFQGRHKDGHEIPLEISIGEHFVGGRRVLMGIVRDIAERRRAEQARSEAQRRLAAIVEGSEDAILTKDLDGTITSWNPGAERVYGYTAAEAIGQNISILVPPDRTEEFTQAMVRLRRGEKINLSETVRLRKDGRKIVVSANVSPLRDHEGRLIGGSTIARDITEQRRAEEVLQAREAQFRSMIEGAPNGLVAVDGQGRIMTINSQVEQLFGYRRDDLVGQPVEILLPERYRTEHPDLRNAFWESPEARPMGIGRDLFARRKDGSEFPVEIGLNPIETPEGRLVLASIADITERKKAEVESSRIAQELTNLIDTANAPIFGIDRDGRVTEWNRTAVAITGYEKRETLGRNLVEDFITEEYKIPVKEVLDKALMGNETANFEFPLYTKKRDRRDVLLNATTRRDVQGNIIGVIGVGQDITERKRAEQALVTSEAKFRGLIESAPDGVFVVDTEGMILETNPAGERMVGRSRADLVGRPLTDLASLERVPILSTYISDRIEGRPGPELYEGLWTGAANEPIHIQITSQVVQTANAPPHLLMVVRDVTERWEMQRRLVESERWASMGRLASFVAHEINTPLTNISLLTAGVSRRVSDPEAQERLKKISAQGKIAASITSELLRFARPGIINPVPTDLKDLVKGAIEQTDVFRKPGTECRAELGPKPLVCNVDPLRIHEVVVNLLKNAYDATQKGRVKVRLEELGPFVAVSVADTGAGIPLEIQPRIFEPFFTTKKKGEGTGLGLAICRNFVVSHGGDITVASDVGKGSTFTVVLPRQPPATPPGA